MDMWDPYIEAAKQAIPDAEKKIVFERKPGIPEGNKAFVALQ